jgi:hypothetical protein
MRTDRVNRRSTNICPVVMSVGWNVRVLENVNSEFLIGRIYCKPNILTGGTRWRSWLRHRATSWKFAGSDSDMVCEIFRRPNPFGRSVTLGSTQPLGEMSTRDSVWGLKAARAWDWQPCHPLVPIFWIRWQPQPPGALVASLGQRRVGFS